MQYRPAHGNDYPADIQRQAQHATLMITLEGKTKGAPSRHDIHLLYFIIYFFLFSNSWSKFTPAFEITDLLKFRFLSKKIFIVGKVKNEKITRRLIAENLNILFFFLSTYEKIRYNKTIKVN